ncbi:MAG: nucleotidyl transferase AbiEii/AbiGii toxin family protein, partial [Caldilineaceae bacterium]|nr:nucleotidyl transferase AbiEii/AbiGii toxin family protein [Caldilineaceae bacterium]
MAILTPVHWQTVTPQMRDVIDFLGNQDFMQDFYLAGGTALALREGHRISVDLDFFSATIEVTGRTRQDIVQSLSSHRVQVLENVDGNLLLTLKNLRVGFFGYGYPMLATTDSINGVAVASLSDIGLMKLDALISRGSRKDFYDLYVIAQHISLAELLILGQTKYPYTKDFALMAIESLVLFDNADRDLQPQLLIDLTWSEVRAFFIA